LRSSYAGGLDITATFSGNTQAGTPDWPASTALIAIVEVEAVKTEITAERTKYHRGSGRGTFTSMRAFSTLFLMPIKA
jgi:hypothetical protein